MEQVSTPVVADRDKLLRLVKAVAYAGQATPIDIGAVKPAEMSGVEARAQLEGGRYGVYGKQMSFMERMKPEALTSIDDIDALNAREVAIANTKQMADLLVKKAKETSDRVRNRLDNQIDQLRVAVDIALTYVPKDWIAPEMAIKIEKTDALRQLEDQLKQSVTEFEAWRDGIKPEIDKVGLADGALDTAKVQQLTAQIAEMTAFLATKSEPFKQKPTETPPEAV